MFPSLPPARELVIPPPALALMEQRHDKGKAPIVDDVGPLPPLEVPLRVQSSPPEEATSRLAGIATIVDLMGRRLRWHERLGESDVKAKKELTALASKGVCSVIGAFGLWRNHFGGLARELGASWAIQEELSGNCELLEGFLQAT